MAQKEELNSLSQRFFMVVEMADDEILTDCRRAEFIDCRSYKKCLDEAARWNLEGVFCQDCTEYAKDPNYNRDLRQSAYIFGDSISTVGNAFGEGRIKYEKN